MVTSNVQSSSGSAEGPACLVCGQDRAHVFFEMHDVPVLCNAPCETQEAARRFPTGRIELAFCSHCGFVFNRAFLPEAVTYDQRYENSLHFSVRFREYIEELASDLVSRVNLYGKDIIEIGCGKGDFLALLCERGKNRGIGFDPSYEPDRLDDAAVRRLQIVPDLYSEAYGQLACDFLCCRHTLEHVPDPAAFLKNVRRALGSKHDTVVFFEVPNALYTLRHRGIWDIIYEHVSYFWSLPLSRLFAESGFSVRAVRETYGGQFLCIEAVPSLPGETSTRLPADAEQLDRVAEEVRLFGETFRSALQAATRVLEGLERRKQRAVIWGAGSKGATFLNLFKHWDILQYAVDINPHKQGKYVPGTGQCIVPPDLLRDYQPAVVFVMNPIYQDEIAQHIAALSLQTTIVTV